MELSQGSIESLSEGIFYSGYVVIRECAAEIESRELFERIGSIAQIEGLRPIQQLVPKGVSESPLNTYSGNFGTGRFPLHTDLAHWNVPPRYFALRCLNGSAEVSTEIYDGNEIVRTFGLEVLRSVLVMPRRRLAGKNQLLSLAERDGDENSLRLRWDSIYLKPATPTSSVVCEQISRLLASAQSVKIALLNRGDLLVVDNWRCLHGRSEIPERSNRVIERAYLRGIR